MLEDPLYWADRIALEILNRVENSEFLQKIVKKNGYVVYDEKTPSGTIHVGSGRGWIIHDCIVKSLRRIGADAKFILSSDDMDPLDKPNKELGDSWNKYLGTPFRDIPSPLSGYKSFADYYFSQAIEKFDEWGIEAEIQSTGDRYYDGSFNSQIRKILDNAEKIQKIYADLYGDTAASRKLPFNVKCPSCGKIATTIATKWDSIKEQVYFECCNNVVKFAQGCGYKGWLSPYDGNGKLPWKVEWAAKWPMIGVIYETAGKDHFSKGGSRTIACRIAVDVLDYPPPLPSNGYETGKGYEFFTVAGAKMSTSKGMGISFGGVTQYAPAKMLRYLIVKTRTNAVIDFNPYNDHDLLLLYDRYDKTEELYFDKVQASEDEKALHKRIYELSATGELPSNCPPHISLSTAAAIIQITLFDIARAIELLKNLGHIDENEGDLEAVKERLMFAKHWVKDFASENYKFEVKTKIESAIIAKLSLAQKKALHLLKERLAKNDYNENSLAEEFYNIRDELQIDIKDFYKAVYLVLIGKEQGPKLAPFILLIGKEKVSRLLNIGSFD